jgi:Outer membrane protein beta-barrel domain
MPVDALLLVAAMLVEPPTAGGGVIPRPEGARGDTVAPPSVSAQTATRRRVGFGGTIVGSNNGVGGSVRYWFNNRFGMDAGGLWYRGRHYETASGTFERTSAALFSTTGLALLSAHDPKNEIDLRPIVGAGANYIRSSQFRVNGELTTANPQGWGWHALGGVEAAFVQGFALTGALAYHRLPGDFQDAGLFNGFNLVVSIHAYF